ncbi:MAG TPA: tRNA (adenosine(37)-N6)-threonylcarbamoyltransferase complex transferase subunit TsaD [Candidatus Saccharimonadales bacterium]|nr:tRNA (adenosine(37)-N6)-threonylcarbamoyltransferase complex transferase subunit TsaD [Candidatus Saccharimonadales bacterium]
MRVLGIETSCDETAAAVVEDGHKLLSNVVASSLSLHVKYGGVVPEIAARSHIESINSVIDRALRESLDDGGQSLDSPTSNVKPLTSDDLWQQIDAIAVTQGAGLGGSLLVGVLAARTMAIIKNKPLYAINHVMAHVYANFITEASPSLSAVYRLPFTIPAFPMLALIVSGGHTQLVLFTDHFKYKLLGQTHDDAIGEAFDKVAKMLGLPYPGGPSVEKIAKNGNPSAFNFPKAKMPGKYDFSFSGLKTAVLRTAQELTGHSYDFPSHKLSGLLTEPQKADIAASFQRVAIETVVDKTFEAFKEFSPKSVVIAGGVAASQALRHQLTERLPLKIEYTDSKLCTDNGAMVAALGFFTAEHKQAVSSPLSLEITPNLSM